MTLSPITGPGDAPNSRTGERSPVLCPSGRASYFAKRPTLDLPPNSLGCYFFRGAARIVEDAAK